MGRDRPFTDLAVKNLKPSATRREVPDPGCRGLYCIIQSSGRRGFAVRFRFRGVPRKLTLQAGITLAAARKAATDALFEVQQGRDPTATKQEAKRTQRLAEENTVEAVCGEYFRRVCGMRTDAAGGLTFDRSKLRTGAERHATLERLVFPVIGDLPINQVRRSDLIKLLDKIEDERGPVMADRSLAAVRIVFNWYGSRSDDFNSPIARNMARTKPKERARRRVLADDEIRDVWAALDTAATPACYPSYIRALLLTGVRRNELADMVSSEIDGDVWTIPGERYKNKLPHVVPLTKQLLALLPPAPEDFEGSARFVFSSTGEKPFSGFSKAKRALDAEIARRRKAEGRPAMPQWQLHDLRRSARSLLSRCGVSSDLGERVLGHVIPGVAGTYDRHSYLSEKRDALERLARLIDTILTPPTGNVVEMKRSTTS
jgi:integrase